MIQMSPGRAALKFRFLIAILPCEAPVFLIAAAQAMVCNRVTLYAAQIAEGSIHNSNSDDSKFC